MALIQLGFTVETASDGDVALAKLETTKYDAIVLDIGLPRVDGWEVARQIRTATINHSTPIIMVTGTAERQAVRDALAAGVNVFLHKPFAVAAFHSAIRSAIR